MFRTDLGISRSLSQILDLLQMYLEILYSFAVPIRQENISTIKLKWRLLYFEYLYYTTLLLILLLFSGMVSIIAL